METKKAKVIKALPFGESGVCEVLRYTKGHSIYVKIPIKMSPYKDQDYWQVMEGKYDFVSEDTPLSFLEQCY